MFGKDDSTPPVVVYSPARWDYAWMRPQQVFTRLAAHRQVFYVEEPCYDPHPMPRWEFQRVGANLTVCRPYTPVRVPGFNASQAPSLRRLMRDLFIERGLDHHVAWLCTPTALPLADSLAARFVVYDSAGEAARFLEAPPEFQAAERALLARAELVFTEASIPMPAGRASRLVVLDGHVDVAHFARARELRHDPEDQRRLPRPRFGYFGVIDDRIDTDLLAGIADARPDWSLVMIGPVTRRDPAALPRRDNLAWLGTRDFVDLPSYLCGWDAAVLPLFTHEGGRPVGMTRALECMAAGRPVVSTPIPDLVEAAFGIARFGRSVDEFVTACERTLDTCDSEHERRVREMDALLARHTCDAAVATMNEQLRVLETGRTPRPIAPPVPAPTPAPEIVPIPVPAPVRITA